MNATPVDPATGVVYPVGLRLHGRHVVVVGGGQVAHRRVAGLLEARARVTVVSPEVTPALEALVEPGSLTWVARRYETGDLDGAWYAVAATDDPAVNAAVAEEAERARIFCARADDRSQSSAWTPAVGRHGDLVVGVHGGGDPQRAVGVRDAVVAGLTDGSVADRASRTPHGARPGSVVLVGGGPGDPGLITVRGRQAVAQADVVVADHLAPLALLASLPTDVEVIDASKLPRGRSMAQEQINALLIEHARAGRRVVRLKGGDPFVFGRGMEELEACVAAGVAVEVVPGVTSAIAVPGAGRHPGDPPRADPRVRRRLRAPAAGASAVAGGLGGDRAAARHRRRPHGRGHRAGDRRRARRARARAGDAGRGDHRRLDGHPAHRPDDPRRAPPGGRRRVDPPAGRLGGRRRRGPARPGRAARRG